MNNNNDSFNEDWGIPENNPTLSNKNVQQNVDEWGTPEKKNVETVNTILGTMPKEYLPLKFGTPENKELTEQLIGATSGGPGMQVVGNAAKQLPSVVKTLFTKIAPEAVVQSVQKGHDILAKEASDIYNFVKEKAKNMKINLNPDVVKEAEDYLPKSKKVKRLLEDAKSGNYQAIHDIQSELGDLGARGLSADLPSAVREGREMLDIRERINQAIENHFINTGENDLAHLLKRGRNKFKEKMDTYYEHAGVGKMVDPELRKVPSNIINFFSEKSKPMATVIARHPEIKNMIETAKSKDKILKVLKNAGYFGLPAAGSIGGAAYLLRNLLSPNLSNPYEGNQ